MTSSPAWVACNNVVPRETRMAAPVWYCRRFCRLAFNYCATLTHRTLYSPPNELSTRLSCLLQGIIYILIIFIIPLSGLLARSCPAGQRYPPRWAHERDPKWWISPCRGPSLQEI